MIVIVDYGVGNVGSIKNMLKKVGAQVMISRNPEDLSAAEKLILPGVGAFGYCMQQLQESGLVDLLTERVLQDQCPLLGICVGMQLLARESEEGAADGLGWIDATVKKFRFDSSSSRPLRVPHMGWNIVTPDQGGALLNSDFDEQRFYFVHSYFMQCRDTADVIGWTSYGDKFASVVKRGNIHGVQFHPEKSHKFGMELLRNYAAMP